MILRFNVYGTRCEVVVDLAEVCRCEGQKVKVETKSGRWAFRTEYPAPRRKKLFRLIIDNMEPDILDDIQQYLTDNSKNLGAEFQAIRGI